MQSRAQRARPAETENNRSPKFHAGSMAWQCVTAARPEPLPVHERFQRERKKERVRGGPPPSRLSQLSNLLRSLDPLLFRAHPFCEEEESGFGNRIRGLGARRGERSEERRGEVGRQSSTSQGAPGSGGGLSPNPVELSARERSGPPSAPAREEVVHARPPLRPPRGEREGSGAPARAA